MKGAHRVGLSSLFAAGFGRDRIWTTRGRVDCCARFQLTWADYVRGRMMTTHIRVWPAGVVEIDTINRHQMATRWIELLKGKKHLRFVVGDSSSPQ